MRRFRPVISACAVAACAVLISTGSAHAYIDPGTGSYILQIVIAGLLGAAFTLKMFWRKIQLFFHRGSSKQDGRKAEKPTGKDG